MNKYYEDIYQLIQSKINELTLDLYKNDKCKPKFTVSIYSEDEYDKLLLTVEHLGNAFTEVLFPRDDRYYGYDRLTNIIENLYNRTM